MGTRYFGFYRRGRFWWVRTDPITKAPRSTKCTDIDAAKRWRRERERLAADPAHAAQATATLGEWGGRLLAMKRASRSAATAQVCEQKLGHWIRIFGSDAPLTTITPDAVDDYVAQRRAEGVTDHTIVKELGELTQALKLAKRSGCYGGDLQALRPIDLHAGYKPRKRALSEPEVGRLLANLEPGRAAAVALMVGLGLRLSEAFRLLPTDIDLQGANVFIDGTKTEEAERSLPIVSYFAPLVRASVPYLPLAEWDNIRRDLARACRRAKIDTCTPNDLRRTHSTLLKQLGASSDTTRRLMGHTSDRMVATVYDKPTAAQLSERVEREIAIQKRDNGFLSVVLSLEPASGFGPETCGLRNPDGDIRAAPRYDVFAQIERMAVCGATWPELGDVTKSLHRGALLVTAGRLGLRRKVAA